MDLRVRSAAMALAAASFAAAAVAVTGASSSSAAPAKTTKGVVAVPAVSLVSRDSDLCSRPTCVPDAGRAFDPDAGFYPGIVTGAKGSLFGAVTVPAGARITKLGIQGFDRNSASSEARFSVAIYASRPGTPRAKLLGLVSLPGGSKRYVSASVTIPRSRNLVRLGTSVFVEARFPVPADSLPAGLSQINVFYEVAEEG